MEDLFPDWTPQVEPIYPPSTEGRRAGGDLISFAGERCWPAPPFSLRSPSPWRCLGKGGWVARGHPAAADAASVYPGMPVNRVETTQLLEMLERVADGGIQVEVSRQQMVGAAKGADRQEPAAREVPPSRRRRPQEE